MIEKMKTKYCKWINKRINLKRMLRILLEKLITLLTTSTTILSAQKEKRSFLTRRPTPSSPSGPAPHPGQGSPSTVDQQSPACDGPITPRLDGSPYGRVQFPQLLITASSGRRALSASFIWRRLQL